LKLQIDLDGETYSLELEIENGRIRYSVEGFEGDASVAETMPGVFSVLVGDRSFLVTLGSGEAAGSDFEVWPNGGQRHAISLADVRDRSSRRAPSSGNGPVEVRAQMPGKVIKVLAAPGASVEMGEGLVVVEAMKMQNEMKAPKSGRVVRIHVKEGATVAAGEPLVVVE
jgi:acetyl/propionyl-CoA carboxylase alpha subunit